MDGKFSVRSFQVQHCAAAFPSVVKWQFHRSGQLCHSRRWCVFFLLLLFLFNSVLICCAWVNFLHERLNLMLSTNRTDDVVLLFWIESHFTVFIFMYVCCVWCLFFFYYFAGCSLIAAVIHHGYHSRAKHMRWICSTQCLFESVVCMIGKRNQVVNFGERIWHAHDERLFWIRFMATIRRICRVDNIHSVTFTLYMYIIRIDKTEFVFFFFLERERVASC